MLKGSGQSGGDRGCFSVAECNFVADEPNPFRNELPPFRMIATIKQFLEEEKKCTLISFCCSNFCMVISPVKLLPIIHQDRSHHHHHHHHHSKCAPVDLVVFSFSEIGGSGPKGRHRHTRRSEFIGTVSFNSRNILFFSASS